MDGTPEVAERPYVPGPRADYICIDCEAKGHCSAEQPWRDLPVKDARCPQCGKKKSMQRMWSGYSPVISTGGTRQQMIAANELVGAAGYDQQRTVKMNAWRNKHNVPWMPRITSMRNLSGAIKDATQGAVPGINLAAGAGEARPSNLPLQATAAGEGVAGAVRMPRTIVTARDDGA